MLHQATIFCHFAEDKPCQTLWLVEVYKPVTGPTQGGNVCPCPIWIKLRAPGWIIKHRITHQQTLISWDTFKSFEPINASQSVDFESMEKKKIKKIKVDISLIQGPFTSKLFAF